MYSATIQTVSCINFSFTLFNLSTLPSEFLQNIRILKSQVESRAIILIKEFATSERNCVLTRPRKDVVQSPWEATYHPECFPNLFICTMILLRHRRVCFLCEYSVVLGEVSLLRNATSKKCTVLLPPFVVYPKI